MGIWEQLKAYFTKARPLKLSLQTNGSATALYIGTPKADFVETNSTSNCYEPANIFQALLIHLTVGACQLHRS